MTGNRVRDVDGGDMQQRAWAGPEPRAGLEPRAAAARTEPLHVGRPLYQVN